MLTCRYHGKLFRDFLLAPRALQLHAGSRKQTHQFRRVGFRRLRPVESFFVNRTALCDLFAAKYLEGGGVFSIPLQWMLELRRRKPAAIWLELLPTTANAREDQHRIKNFQRRLRGHGFANHYCLLYEKSAGRLKCRCA
jgi:hypothetical protein